MSDAIIAYIRTYVPVLVGSAAAWLLSAGVNLDPATQAGAITFLTGLLIALYYTAVRLIAKKFPWVEVLLGSKATPTYTK